MLWRHFEKLPELCVCVWACLCVCVLIQAIELIDMGARVFWARSRSLSLEIALSRSRLKKKESYQNIILMRKISSSGRRLNTLADWTFSESWLRYLVKAKSLSTQETSCWPIVPMAAILYSSLIDQVFSFRIDSNLYKLQFLLALLLLSLNVHM